VKRAQFANRTRIDEAGGRTEYEHPVEVAEFDEALNASRASLLRRHELAQRIDADALERRVRERIES
jgi:hypothetical protein